MPNSAVTGFGLALSKEQMGLNFLNSLICILFLHKQAAIQLMLFKKCFNIMTMKSNLVILFIII